MELFLRNWLFFVPLLISGVWERDRVERKREREREMEKRGSGGFDGLWHIGSCYTFGTSNWNLSKMYRRAGRAEGSGMWGKGGQEWKGSSSFSSFGSRSVPCPAFILWIVYHSIKTLTILGPAFFIYIFVQARRSHIGRWCWNSWK